MSKTYQISVRLPVDTKARIKRVQRALVKDKKEYPFGIADAKVMSTALLFGLEQLEARIAAEAAS